MHLFDAEAGVDPHLEKKIRAPVLTPCIFFDNGSFINSMHMNTYPLINLSLSPCMHKEKKVLCDLGIT
jgi:hypothetical protein